MVSHIEPESGADKVGSEKALQRGRRTSDPKLCAAGQTKFALWSNPGDDLGRPQYKRVLEY